LPEPSELSPYNFRSDTAELVKKKMMKGRYNKPKLSRLLLFLTSVAFIAKMDIVIIVLLEDIKIIRA
jgi:hypothetical protein